MNNWIDNSISEYHKWFQDKTQILKDEMTGWYSISTPFVGLFNDTIDIYAKSDNNGQITLSDDGQTLVNLELAGTVVSRSPKRKEWLDMILLNYGITLADGNELQTISTEHNFPQKKFNLISAIIEVSDMAMMAKHTISSLFKEDVRSFFDEQQMIYTPEFIAKGSTGIEFTFDFQIAGRKKELVVKSFNSLNKMNVPNFLFGWEDIKESRERISGKKLDGIAIINDLDKDLKPEYIDALKSKGAVPILWSQRNLPEIREKLIA